MWYYIDANNDTAGPLNSEAMHNQLHARTINQRTPVWQEGMPRWKKLGDTELAPHINAFMLSTLMQWWLIFRSCPMAIMHFFIVFSSS
jgi:hypothetical protein